MNTVNNYIPFFNILIINSLYLIDTKLKKKCTKK